MQEQSKPKGRPKPGNQDTPDRVHVFAERNWKEYLGESLLIVFSVMLALFTTEYINARHTRENTRAMLADITAELEHNRSSIVEMQQYDKDVLNRIDTLLVSKDLSTRLISGDDFHLQIIAPSGVLYRYLDDEAWTVAKNADILSRIEVGTATTLSKVYGDQQRIGKVEDEVARVILSRDARDPQKAHQTLVLIRDIYHGWAVDRMPGLLPRIDSAISLVRKEFH